MFFGRCRRSHRAKLTGMLAAEERVKNAVIALWVIVVKMSGYGFLRQTMKATSGFKIKATINMVATKTTTTWT